MLITEGILNTNLYVIVIDLSPASEFYFQCLNTMLNIVPLDG